MAQRFAKDMDTTAVQRPVSTGVNPGQRCMECQRPVIFPTTKGVVRRKAKHGALRGLVGKVCPECVEARP